MTPSVVRYHIPLLAAVVSGFSHYYRLSPKQCIYGLFPCIPPADQISTCSFLVSAVRSCCSALHLVVRVRLVFRLTSPNNVVAFFLIIMIEYIVVVQCHHYVRLRFEVSFQLSLLEDRSIGL